MIESQLEMGGAVTFWSLADWSDRGRLHAALTHLGYAAFVPEPRAEATVLKDALEEVLGGPRVLVRPLASRDGFAVVREERGMVGNNYATLLIARVQQGQDPTFEPWTLEANRVETAYRQQLGRIPATQLSNALVKLIDALGGTRLRPSGAVYWLPGHRLDEWTRIVQAAEQASQTRPNAVYVLRHRLDADAVRAVRDAVVHEVQLEAQRLAEEITAGDLGGRALETRKNQLLALREKVNLYEDMLNVGLNGLHQVLDRADQATATATLLLGSQVSLSNPPATID
jgi:hypothetical protein